MRVDRRTKRNIKKNRMNLLLVTGVVLILCIGMSFSQRKLEAQEKACGEQIKELEEELAEQEKRAEDIEDYKTHVQTKKFIEEEAREKLGLVYPDEVIFQAED